MRAALHLSIRRTVLPWLAGLAALALAPAAPAAPTRQPAPARAPAAPVPAGPASSGPASPASASSTPASAASGLGLDGAWQLAKAHDPTYQAALSERDAGQANRALGRAPLLPQISASIGRNKTTGTLESPSSSGGVVSTDLDYIARTNQIQLSQSLFDWSKIAGMRQGNARADYSLALFDTKARDTATRLVSRYLQTLLSRQNVTLAENRLAADEQNIDIARRRYQGGEGTVTDVEEATSRRDLSRADLIQARDALVVARRELQEMTGAPVLAIHDLAPDFRPRPLDPPALEAWLARAQAANADVQAGQQSLRVADREVDKAFGGHLPTVGGVAYRSVNQSDSISTLNQESYLTAAGVQISVPIFSGGQTQAQVRQARHNRDQTGHQLEATREKVAVDTTRQYQGVVSGAERIAALETAVNTSAQALEAMRKSYIGGTRSITDILDAQDQLYKAQRDLIQARLQYVNARIGLDAVAGALDDAAIAAAARTWFGSAAVALD